MIDTLQEQHSVKLLLFKAEGVIGEHTYTLDLKDRVRIIVGPNGTGKSTFLSLFYLFLSRQWSRLAEYSFKQLTLVYSTGNKQQEINIKRQDLMNVGTTERLPPRLRRMIDQLNEPERLALFSDPKPTKIEREKLAGMLSVSVDELTWITKLLRNEIGLTDKAVGADTALRSLSIGRVLYMPTYRRIEKDLKDIFPDIEDRLRTRLDEYHIIARAGVHFQEIVSFGMEDISSIISAFSVEVGKFQRLQTEKASQEYIRDIVKGALASSSMKGIREISEERVRDFVNDLDATLFTSGDREILRQRIQQMREIKQGRSRKDQQYFGLFVEKQLAAHNSVKEREKPLLDFTKYVSKYLGNNKTAIYNNLLFRIEDSNSKKEIRLNDLSSGEKQIVSIFAYLLLKEKQKYILFIDEPELSLSVPWQKDFLPDLLATERCDYVFSVTHSPFVFDNALRKNVVDVERLMSSS